MRKEASDSLRTLSSLPTVCSLKNEGRIVAMVMVMGLALVVYSLAEKKLREALESENETIPNQKNKPTKKPTMRRVF
ncbi:MAG: hypothetical protein ACNYVW_08760 [Methanosarcinales archaeon]